MIQRERSDNKWGTTHTKCMWKADLRERSPRQKPTSPTERYYGGEAGEAMVFVECE